LVVVHLLLSSIRSAVETVYMRNVRAGQ
jgi:hypothetical protein